VIIPAADAGRCKQNKTRDKIQRLLHNVVACERTPWLARSPSLYIKGRSSLPQGGPLNLALPFALSSFDRNSIFYRIMEAEKGRDADGPRADHLCVLVHG
jgi:hypothetical protein